jgi:hypothetical protein
MIGIIRHSSTAVALRIDPSTFSTTITNPYLPLSPGTRTIFEAATPEGLQRTTTEVTRDTKKVMRVDTVVVHDTVTLDGKLTEDTFDEYAQGVAEDTGEVLNLTGTETTPLTGAAKDLLVTKDADLLDPTGGVENKYYARGTGLILTVQVTGGAERDQATAADKF